MIYYLDRLKNELKGILDFWLNHAIDHENKSIHPEISKYGKANPNAPLGSIYLSRVIYGALAGSQFLDDNKYAVLAEIAYLKLTKDFISPSGGYLWGISEKGQTMTDPYNMPMAQAFVLFGLSEYYRHHPNQSNFVIVREQVQHIINRYKDPNNAGYLDGISPLEERTPYRKSLKTHLHLLEAFTKYFQATHDASILKEMHDILDILTSRFINQNELRIARYLGPEWEITEEENSTGQLCELSWMLSYYSGFSNDDKVKALCQKLAIRISDWAIDNAFDKKYGGMLSTSTNEVHASFIKDWWPQTEASLAFLNAYSISKDKKYLSFAIRLIEYIENTFSDEKLGEWNSSISRTGQPDELTPKVHFWKSLYHNVRYCIETHSKIKTLARVYS